ncbi:MAG: N-acetyltransferase, partial [Bacteroidota bacterium]|nr:N-acetyltransferase [Bacteroidota bacterium]
MNDVKLNLDANGRGEFYITEDNKEKAKMLIDITGNDLTAFHTKVLPEYEGKGLAKKLVEAMVDYARKNHLMVTAFCPYIYARFS